MPTALIPFPSFDPVLISIGPFAVRWYALAYICGILFGWLYARTLIANDRLWGGPAPLTVADYDDFILWVTLGIILGGRIGYILFYNLPHFLEHPLEIFEVWKGGMSFHGGFLGCVIAVLWFAYHRGIPALSLGDITCAVGPIGLFLGRIANFVNGELWGRPTDVPWAMIFPLGGPLPRHPSQLYEASLEGLGLLIILALFIRAGALKRPGTHSRPVRHVLCGVPLVLRILPRARPAARLPVGPHDHGHDLVHPAVHRRRGICRLRAPPQAAAFVMSAERTPLDAVIRARIAREGPMPIATFMALCLYDPDHGYYLHGDPLGAAGDFVTAPEVSQMFGEMIGLWAAEVWQEIGAPAALQLIEIGPGRGTMMLDAIRAARAAPEFRRALHVHLIEVSPALRQRQAHTLRDAGDVPVRWHATLAEIPPGPAIVLANEFFDALPVHQAERRPTGWHERRITVNAGDELAFTLAPDPIAGFERQLPPAVAKAPVGAVFEWRTDRFAPTSPRGCARTASRSWSITAMRRVPPAIPSRPCGPIAMRARSRCRAAPTSRRMWISRRSGKPPPPPAPAPTARWNRACGSSGSASRPAPARFRPLSPRTSGGASRRT